MASHYSVVVLPKSETLNYLKSLFGGSSLPVDWDGVYVELGTVMEPSDVELNESAIYQALPGSLDRYYDSATARSWVILPLFASPHMARRADAIGSVFGLPFRAFMPISDGGNNMRRSKAGLNSIATSLVDTQPVLLFHGEMLIPSPFPGPSFSDFRSAYTGSGVVNNQVFLDLDEGIE